MVLKPTDFSNLDDYVATVKELPEATAHVDDPDAAAEHAAVLALAPRPKATNVAVKNGLWSSSDTWYQGLVPQENARVLIPEAIEILCNVRSSLVHKSVRADGALMNYDHENMKLTVESLVISKTGRLDLRSATSRSAIIMIAGSGLIDETEDPYLIGRGLLNHGRLTMIGASKTRYLKLGKNALRGDRTIQVAFEPENWKIGERIVITGTKWRPWDNKGYHGTYDEVRLIENIDGFIITLNRPLKFNHTSPMGRPDLTGHVANLSSNVSVRSLNKSIIEERGHVMCLHNPDIVVDNIAFIDLGRTDKSQRAIEAANRGTNRNVKGRYSFHVHHAGVMPSDLFASVSNSVVVHSPGWGFVTHASKSNMNNNVTYDTFGAGFVAEAGNEMGFWPENLAIKAQGVSGGGDWAEKGSDDVTLGDMGRTGSGFWFAGRLIKLDGNIATGVEHGIVYMHRGAPEKVKMDQLEEFPEMFRFRDELPVDHVPIRHLTNMEVYASTYGGIVIKANPSQEHDVRSIWDGFKAWRVSNGIDLSYTAHYTLKNLDMIGSKKLAGGYGFGRFGVNTGTNTNDIVIFKAEIVGFNYGIDFGRVLPVVTTPPMIPADQFGHVMIDVNCHDQYIAPFNNVDPATDLILKSGDLTPGRLSLLVEPLQAWSLDKQRNVPVKGVKTDSIGNMLFPIANESFKITTEVLSGFLYRVGFYRDPVSKRNYILYPEYYSDRVTGEVKQQILFMWMDIYNNLGLDANNQPIPGWKGPSYWLPHGPAKFLGDRQ